MFRNSFPALRSTLSALVLSATVAIGALGASTAPAQADSRDAAAVIGGIIALYALSRALDRPDDRQQPSQHSFNPGRPQPYQAPAPSRRMVAPDQCYREFQTRDGFFRGYAGDCLQRNVRHTLPDACAREFRTDRGRREFYGSRCMAQYGWVVEGRQRH
jgi:hypothetical protein